MKIIISWMKIICDIFRCEQRITSVVADSVEQCTEQTEKAVVASNEQQAKQFEEEANSQEIFYGAIKVKGSEVELQMVDFIESVAVPVSGTGKLRENSGEIVFTFTDQHVLETFKKAGINLANGEIVDLQIRWY